MANEEVTSQGAASSQKRQTRGVNTLARFLKNPPPPEGGYPIEFDESTGKVQGQYAAKYATYTAVLARNKVSILFPDWKSVDDKTKDMIWQDMTTTFNLPKTKAAKDKWLTLAATRWRAFKSQLTTTYIYGNGDGNAKSPVGLYQGLSPEIWESFVKTRLENPKFQEERKKYKDLAAKNLYPHRVSRGGYRTLTEKEMKKRLATSGDGGDDVPPAFPTRNELWVMARTDKTGTISHEPTSRIASRIESLVEEANQGKFVPDDPRTDILVEALGTAEHRGRVRTAGYGVGLKNYYGGKARKDVGPQYSKEDLDAIVNKRVEEATSALKDQLRDQSDQLAAQLREEMQQIYTQQQQSVHHEDQAVALARSKKEDTRASCSNADVNAKAIAHVDPGADHVDYLALAREFTMPDRGYLRLPLRHCSDCSISVDRYDLRYITSSKELLSDCHLDLWLS